MGKDCRTFLQSNPNPPDYDKCPSVLFTGLWTSTQAQDTRNPQVGWMKHWQHC